MKSALKLPLGTFLSKCSVIIVALGLSGGVAFAAATASDTASNYATPGWSSTPSNLGTGFGAWSITINNNDGPPYAGTYLDTSDSVLDGGGHAWATYANNATSLLTPSVSIVRPFTTGGGTASLYNQTFSFDLSSAGVGPGQGLLEVQVGNAFTFEYNGTASGDNMYFSDPTSGLITTPVDFSELGSGLLVSVSVSGALNSPSEGYTFTVSPYAGGSPLYTTSSTFDSSVYNTSSFTYLDSNTTGNGYFNGLNITPVTVPEPTTLALVGLSGLMTLLSIRRRK
jgi:hypothetical protein